MMPSPHYYMGVYGDPDPPGRVTVEGGVYGSHRDLPPEMAAGDFLLIYCTGTYKQYPRSTPGFGLITRVDRIRSDFFYTYLSLAEPVPLELLRLRLTEIDREKLANIRFDTYWLFKISEESFKAVMEVATVYPPKE